MSCDWLAAIMREHSPERAAFEEGYVKPKPKGYITPVEGSTTSGGQTTTTVTHPNGTKIVTTSMQFS